MWKDTPVFAYPTEGFCLSSLTVYSVQCTVSRRVVNVLGTVFCHDNETTNILETSPTPRDELKWDKALFGQMSQVSV